VCQQQQVLQQLQVEAAWLPWCVLQHQQLLQQLPGCWPAVDQQLAGNDLQQHVTQHDRR
jgi:hypothetical protein